MKPGLTAPPPPQAPATVTDDITPPTNPENPSLSNHLNISGFTRDRLAQIFNIPEEQFRIIDSDGSGSLSAGDYLAPPDTDFQAYTFTNADIRTNTVRGGQGPILENQPRALFPNPNSTGLFGISQAVANKLEQDPFFTDIAYFDNNGEGRLTQGDVIITDINDPNSPEYTVTAEDEATNSIRGISLQDVSPRLELTPEKQQALQTAIGDIFAGRDLFVYDLDQNGSFSAGDSIAGFGTVPNGDGTDNGGFVYTITQDDIDRNVLLGDTNRPFTP